MDSRLKKHALGYWQIVDKPTLPELREYYAEKYYQEAKGGYELKYSDEELAYFNAKLAQRKAVLELHLTSSLSQHTLLDVGCGEGYSLAFFRRLGWKVKGFDFSAAGISSKNPSCLDALVTGDVFEQLDQEVRSGYRYEVVWLQNVLEHVLEPLDLLRSLRNLIAPDGVAVVTVPNDCSITQRAALELGHIEDSFWVVPPDHLTYFDHNSLANAANAAGWQCVEMLSDFPVDWFLFHKGSNYQADRRAGKQAHRARVQIENLIHQQPMVDVIRFWSAAAKLGIGRDITVFLKPAMN